MLYIYLESLVGFLALRPIHTKNDTYSYKDIIAISIQTNTQ